MSEAVVGVKHHLEASTLTNRIGGESVSIDVKTEVVIDRPKKEVASFAMNPDNDPVWIGGIIEARSLTAPPIGKGAQVQRVATFLGKRIEYVNEVTEFDPAGLLVMRSVKGPFPMTIRYEFNDAPQGTVARIEIQGESGGFYRLAGPVLSRTIKRSVTNDLETLKDLLESGADMP